MIRTHLESPAARLTYYAPFLWRCNLTPDRGWVPGLSDEELKTKEYPTVSHLTDCLATFLLDKGFEESAEVSVRLVDQEDRDEDPFYDEECSADPDLPLHILELTGKGIYASVTGKDLLSLLMVFLDQCLLQKIERDQDIERERLEEIYKVLFLGY